MTTLHSAVTADTYDEVLRLAKAALDEAQARYDRLAPRAERAAKPISDDPAIGSGIRRHSTASQVRAKVLGTRGALTTVSGLFLMVAGLYELGDVTVAIGCAGGRHRSYVLAEKLASELSWEGYDVQVEHRDVHLPVVRRVAS